VLNGKLKMEECLLSLNFIYANYKHILPAIVVNEGAELTLNKCEIKGNK
jgi:hypothetical protein